MCFLTASSEATTTEAAPSQIPLALPAVTTPPFLKTAGSLARPSSVVYIEIGRLARPGVSLTRCD